MAKIMEGKGREVVEEMDRYVIIPKWHEQLNAALAENEWLPDQTGEDSEELRERQRNVIAGMLGFPGITLQFQSEINARIEGMSAPEMRRFIGGELATLIRTFKTSLKAKKPA